MVILGVDPGLRNTGYCVLKNGKPVAHGVISPRGRKRLLVSEVLSCVLPALRAVIKEWKPTHAAVEEVTWYGRARKAMLPLSHVAGAVAGLLWAANVQTALMIANQRDKEIKWPDEWTEHERDAAALATALANSVSGKNADDSSVQKRYLAAKARIITAHQNVPGKPSKRG